MLPSDLTSALPRLLSSALPRALRSSGTSPEGDAERDY
jgi:hypothetical protein